MANQNSKNKTNNKSKSNTNKKTNNTNTKKNNTKENVVAENKAKETTKKVVANEKETKKETVKKKPVKKETPIKEEKVKENSKKETKKSGLSSHQKDLILILIVIVLLVVAFFATRESKPKLDIDLPVAVEGEAGFQEITYSEYEAKMAEKKPFLVIIVRDGCGYCEAYEPIVEEVSKEYKVPIYYLNLTHLSEDETTALSSSNSYLKRNEWGTPTTLFLYGDTVVDSIGGYVEKDAFVSFIETNIKVDADV